MAVIPERGFRTSVMKKIYIAGCGGMLGSAFYKEFGNSYELMSSDIDVNEEWLTFCDFRDLAAYREEVSRFHPDYLFHLGAYTDLEYCETHVEDTYMTNVIGVENAVYIANELEVPLLYISTAGIFDGKKETYDDWDVPNPLGHYARSKYAGEVFVRENCDKHLICRAGWMMGGGPRKDKKFVQKVMKQLKDGREELYVVTDKLGTPTYTHDFARNVRLLLENGYWGLYNMVCEGLTSRLEVAREILRILDLESKVTIHEVSSDYFKKEYFAERPPSERLINRKLVLRGLNRMRDWRVALREYLTDAYKEYLEL
jgi:dTDP-4-dehydrorhamnose reductase